MDNQIESKSEETEGCRKVISSIGNWLVIKNKDEWLKDMRGNLSLSATVISTMTFQAAINPPGGVRPETGKAVLAYHDRLPDDYFIFLFWNTICFISSLAVCLLLVSGFPLNHRFFTWLLSICMCITITSLTLTYLFGVQMVTPDPVWDSVITMFQIVLFTWIALLGLIILVLFLRLVVWAVTKCTDKRKR